MKAKLMLLLWSLIVSPVLFAESKIVIAHRGASGYLPEHTLAAKALACAQGADYLEQDLVMTKDDELIVLHDHFLDRVTDVAERFPDRARADGRYYAIDFTLAEIKSLHFSEGFDIVNGVKKQDYPDRFPMGKSDFRIHTFAEEIEFIQGLSFSTGKQIGLYPEIKAPWFHHQEGKDISRKVLATLADYGYRSKQDKIYLQCFDFNEIKRIRQQLMPEMGLEIKLIQLIAYNDWLETYQQNEQGQWVNYDYNWMFTGQGLRLLAEYVDGIGPQYPMLIDKESRPGIVKLTSMVADAHKYGLAIHPYTLRKDALPAYVTNMDELLDLIYIKADVDGAFTDFPDLAVKFLQQRAKHE